MPSITDCEFLLVGEDGSERPIEGVIAASWSVRQGRDDTSKAVLEFEGVEIDADGVLVGSAT